MHEEHPVQGPDDVDAVTANTLRHAIRGWGDFVTRVWSNRAELAAQAGEPPQCRAGCAACCYDYAMVSPSDMFLLIDAYQKLSPDDQAYVRQKNAVWIAAHAEMDGFPLIYDNPDQMTEYGELLARHGADGAKTMTGMTTMLNFQKKTPCSFLKNNRCMVYDSRPLACRGHNIVDKRGPQVCEDVLHFVDEVNVRQYQMSDACAHVIQQFVDAGLPMFPNGEMNTLFARWLNQQDQESK